MAGRGTPPAAAAGQGAGGGPGQTTVQMVQLSAQAKRLQEPLLSVMGKVHQIEVEFDKRDAQLAADKAEMEKQHELAQAQLKQWEALEQAKLNDEERRLELDKQAFKDRMRWERDMLSKDKEAFEYKLEEGDNIAHRQEPVTLEVGGEKFRTELSTLTRCQDSIFPDLVKAVERRHASERDGRPKRDPYIFIDRDARHFRFILNYLRQGEQVMRGAALKKCDKDDLQDILYEVQYYRLTDLERLVRRKVVALKKPKDFRSLAEEANYFRKIAVTTAARSPQAAQDAQHFQYTTSREISVKGENLRGIEFKKVIFEHTVTFQDCILVEAKFVQCAFRGAVDLQNADLYKARFEHCDGIDFVRRFYMDKANTNELAFVPPLVDGDS